MRKDIILKIIKISTIICGIIALVCGTSPFLLPRLSASLLQISINKEASSVGIIGGADGPTAIFLTTSSPPFLYTTVFAILTAMGLVFQIIIKKRNRI